MTHVWWWRKVRPDRKGDPCRVLARGRGPGPRNVLVEFADGEQVVAPMWAVRRHNVRGAARGDDGSEREEALTSAGMPTAAVNDIPGRGADTAATRTNQRKEHR